MNKYANALETHLHRISSTTPNTDNHKWASGHPYWLKRTRRSPSKEQIDLSRASSPNSGNSFIDFMKVRISFANISSCSGNSSGSSASNTVGRIACDAVFFRRFWFRTLLGAMRCSRGCLATFRGNKSAAFSRNKKRICASLSLRWYADERMPTEEPSWREAFAKFLN